MENTAIILFIMFTDVYKTIFTFAPFYSNMVPGVCRSPHHFLVSDDCILMIQALSVKGCRPYSIAWPICYGQYVSFKVFLYAEVGQTVDPGLTKPPYNKTDFRLNDLQVFLTNENKPFQIWISVIKILQSLSFAFRGLMSSHPLLLNVVR